MNAQAKPIGRHRPDLRECLPVPKVVSALEISYQSIPSSHVTAACDTPSARGSHSIITRVPHENQVRAGGGVALEIRRARAYFFSRTVAFGAFGAIVPVVPRVRY